MPHNKAVRKGFHGIGQDVPTDCLHNVLHEFRTVGFDSAPFLCGTYAFIGDRFPTELIDPDPGLDIGQPPAGGKLDEEHSAFIKEADPTYFRLDALRDGGFDGTVDVPPESRDHWIGVSPGVDQRLELFFGQPHFQGSH